MGFAALTAGVDISPRCESEQCVEIGESEHGADWLVFMNYRDDEFWCDARFRAYMMLELQHGGARCVRGHTGVVVGVWRRVEEGRVY